MQTPWYHKTSIYHIYPRSFMDSNADGIGDIRGIISKLDYIRDLGFESIWCSPFFTSPQADFGYDISDYTGIDPQYGNLAEALELIQEVHKRGMRIIFDMVLNHTSIEHPWFTTSRSSRDNPKADWYIWRDTPNNWHCMTGGSGWHYEPQRQQYFWASFLSFQPDLNWRNPQVKEAMFNMCRFWLAKGVDGFRLDIFNTIYKDAEFRDNPFAFTLAPKVNDPSGYFQKALYSHDQPESYELARELRKVCEEFGDVLTVGEVAATRPNVRRFTGVEKNDGLTLAFDFEMLEFQFTAEYFKGLIADIELHFPAPFSPVFVFSNHDKRRSIHRLNDNMQKAKLLHMLQLTLRGVPCIYYGEEIGMSNLQQPFHTALDPIPHKYNFLPRFIYDQMNVQVNRDEVRTPMQWDESQNAGFSAAPKTWLPVHNNYATINVARQMQDSTSLLNTIKRLMSIRNKNEALQAGSFMFLENLPRGILGYQRKNEDQNLIVFLNFDERPKEFTFDFSEVIFALSKADAAKDKQISVGGFGGLILK